MIKDLFILDAHEDIAFHLNYFGRDFVNPEIPCMITLPGLLQGGIGLVFNTIFVHPKHKPGKTAESALGQFAAYEKIYRDHGDVIYQVRSADDLEAVETNPGIGFLTMMEGADPIEEPGKLDEFYARGVRIIALCWNDRNMYASGNDTGEGLSNQGKELIERMNGLGITLDLSHINEAGFREAIELTKLIPIASHSNARSVTDHPRNLGDEQILAIAGRGGVIGLVFYNQFLKAGEGAPTIEDVYRHADYVIGLAGEDHVGIGSDMDGARIEDFPEDLRKISDLPKIADYFLEKGYSEERVRKIMGGNFLRVMRTNLASGA